MTVFVPSSRNRNVRVYHTERCQNVTSMDTVLETTEQEAEKRGLRECKECSGENYQKGVEKDLSFYQAALKAGNSDD